jgi:hypothetical protein
MLATGVALVLDVRVQRGATRRGKFEQLSMGKGGVELGGRAAEEFEANPNLVASSRGKKGRGGAGYEVPEEQFAYEQDLGYHGACGQVGRRSTEERI